MRTMNPLIKQATAFTGRDEVRLGVPRRAAHRMRRPLVNASVIDTVAAADSDPRSLHQFMTAFVGGLVFFSILIF